MNSQPRSGFFAPQLPEVAGSPLFGEDLALVSSSKRNWGLWNVVALIPAITPGFLGAVIEDLGVSLVWTNLYNHAWFISFPIVYMVYCVDMKATVPGDRP